MWYKKDREHEGIEVYSSWYDILVTYICISFLLVFAGICIFISIPFIVIHNFLYPQLVRIDEEKCDEEGNV